MRRSRRPRRSSPIPVHHAEPPGPAGAAREPAPALAAAAWADGPTAVADASAAALAGLHGAPPGLVLVFPDAGMPSEGVLAQARTAAPRCPVAGMTSSGLVTAEGARLGGCTAMAFGRGIAAGVGLAAGASRDLRAAGRAAAEEALAGLRPQPGHAVLLLFIDPTSGDEAAAIDGAYAVTGTRIPLAGGGANGGDPRVIAQDAICRDAVVAVALCSPMPVAVGIGHGCVPRANPAIATRTDGRTVLELDGRPAEDVYLESLGASGGALPDEAFESLAVLHPLAQPELRGMLRLRHVKGRAVGGGLRCATAIPPNAAVWFTEQTEDTIVQSAADAVRAARAALPARPRAALVFDCAARKRALGARLDDEARALLAALGGVPAVAGLYTRGEVGRVRGAKGDRNHAVVVVVLG